MSQDNNIVLHAVKYDDRVKVIHDGQTRGTRVPVVKLDKTMPPVPTWTEHGYRWAWWGDDDRLPTTMREKIGDVPIAGAVLDKKIRMMQGNGIVYYKTADLANGANVERAYVPEVEDWMGENRIETEWFPAQCADFCLPYNTFSELILSNDRSKVTGLYHIAAEHGRLAKANARNQVDFLLYSMHFPFGTAQQDSARVAIPLYKWYDRAAFFNSLRNNKFAWHTRFPTPGLIYYARAWWLGLFKEDGWLDVSGDVPKIVRAMQKNQVKLRYIISIPESYFIIRHPNWMTYTDKLRQEIIDKKIDELNDYLSGTANVAKSISYVFKENEINGVAMGKIEITPVDDKLKEGTWVPDSFAADQQIVQGLGMDPSQIGLSPQSGKMGAGSGSDKRESYNLMITLNTPEQRLVLEPLNFISKMNKWGLTFAVDHTAHTTTNDQESGMAPSPQTTKVNPQQQV